MRMTVLTGAFGLTPAFGFPGTPARSITWVRDQVPSG